MLLLVSSVMLFWNTAKWHPSIKYVVLALLLIPGVWNTLTQRTHGETDLGLFDDLKVQKNAIDWLVAQDYSDPSICTNFITQTYLNTPEAGYVENGEFRVSAFEDVCNGNCNGDLLILTRTQGGCLDQKMKESLLASYALVYTDTIHASYASIYQRR